MREMLLRNELRRGVAVIIAWLLLTLAACSGNLLTSTPPHPPEFSGPTPIPAISFTPLSVTPETAFAKLSVGHHHSCGLTESGRAVCWGLPYGELWTAPREVRFAAVAAGSDFSCGLTYAGAVQCWGANNNGKVTGAPPGRFQALSLGRGHGCALEGGGAPVCWGRNDLGQADPPPGVAFTKIQAGETHSCGLTHDGDLRCWGGNEFGEGQPLSGPFSEVAVSMDTCVARLGGAPFCQGRSRLLPPEADLTQLSVGGGYACGLAGDGRLECWNSLGPTLSRPGPFITVSAGDFYLCALRRTGRAECWNHSADPAASIIEPAYRDFDSADPAASVTEPSYQDFGGGHFRWPVAMFPWPGGSAAVVERQGTISRFSPETAQTPETARADAARQPLLDLAGRVACCSGESGMLSAAVDPEFKLFPFIYVWYTAQPQGIHVVRLSRFPAPDGAPQGDAELIMLELELERQLQAPNHMGGAIRFGPDDGMLYLGIGENQEAAEAQNRASLWGSIIRIDVRRATREQPYRIPPDNPLLDTPGARPEIWAYGLRNPWRMSFDSQGNLWVGDVGGSRQEEISIVTPGANLGWPVFEGFQCRADEAQCAALTEAVPPTLDYGRDDGCAIIWGGEYRGRALPRLRGAPLFTDYCSGQVWALENTPETGWQKRKIAEISGLVNSFGTDAAGEMYLLLVDGAIVPLTQLMPAEPSEP